MARNNLLILVYDIFRPSFENNENNDNNDKLLTLYAFN